MITLNDLNPVDASRTLLVLALAGTSVLAADAVKDSAPKWRAVNYQRKMIYHSPEKPGYTSWVGTWIMPDESIMVTFKQATMPPGGLPPELEQEFKGTSRRRYAGLDLANVYLRSTDGGVTWVKTAEDKFRGPSERPAWGGSHCALKDGSTIRAVDGSQLPSNDVPRIIFFQRSHDLGKTWGPAELAPEPSRPVANFMGDFGDCITRVQRLKDGRLLATGVIRIDEKQRRLGKPLVMFSTDDAKTWTPIPIQLHADQSDFGAWNEWDCAELPKNEFLCMFRRIDPVKKGKQARWQGVLRKKGESWVIEHYRPAIFEHSGHPELLVTREGIILHIATSGVHWTENAGATWHPLHFEKLKDPYRSRYYPVSLQAKDGRIYVCSHLGSDNGYGQVDQAIVMDSFKLDTE